MAPKLISGKYSGFYRLYFLTLVSLAIFIIILGAVDLELRMFILQEDGLVENLTVMGYFACVFLMFRAMGGEAEKHWDIIVVLFAFALRELDFHSRFTSMSMTKIRFFTSAGIPLYQKIVAVITGTLIAYSFFRIVRSHFLPFIASLRKFEPHAVSIFTGLVFIFVSLALDGLSGKLMKIGIEAGPVINGFSDSAEEIFELGIPLMFCLSLKLLFDKKKGLLPS